MINRISKPSKCNPNLPIGSKHGKLTLGDLVSWVQRHPLFKQTTKTYIKHGRLRECYCDCGATVLVSERALLSEGSRESCGCLLSESRLRYSLQLIEIAHWELEKHTKEREITLELDRLEILQKFPEHLRDPLTEKDCLLGIEQRKFRVRQLTDLIRKSKASKKTEGAA